MRIEKSLSLPLAPDALWPWLATPERLGRWIEGVERFESVPPGELAAGSRLIVHLPRGAPVEAQVERAERPSVLVLRARGLPNDLEVEVAFEIRAGAGGSELAVRAETQLRGLMVFAESMIAKKAGAALSTWTESLRAAISAGAAGA